MAGLCQLEQRHGTRHAADLLSMANRGRQMQMRLQKKRVAVPSRYFHGRTQNGQARARTLGAPLKWD